MVIHNEAKNKPIMLEGSNNLSASTNIYTLKGFLLCVLTCFYLQIIIKLFFDQNITF